MKVVLIANISANGQLFLGDNPKHESSPEAMGFILQKAVQAGNIVIGRNTFEVLQHLPGGIKHFLPGVEILVLSSGDQSSDDCVVMNSPEKAIAYLTEKGTSEIIIAGGTQTYNAFLQNDLVTEIYFNYIPTIIGEGGIIGVGADLYTKFKIVEYKMFTDNIAQLHLAKA